MHSRITPQVGCAYWRNLVRQLGQDPRFDMMRGVTVRVDRVTENHVISTVTGGNGFFQEGDAFNPVLHDFTTEFFEATQHD